MAAAAVYNFQSASPSPEALVPFNLTSGMGMDDATCAGDWRCCEFEGIVGSSGALNDLLDHVRIVAPTDATALILGETALKASREMADTVGRIMIARTSVAGSRPGPLKVVRKNGIHPR